MGRAKLLLPLGGVPLIRRVVDALGRIEAAEIVTIVRQEQEAAMREALDETPTRIVVNPDADRGMGTSIACAVRALSAGTECLLLAQGDQPLLSTAAFAAIVENLSTGVAYVAARYGELMTTPVAFARPLFHELAALDGDRGARSVLDAHRDEGVFLDLPEWMGLDVDDEAGYRRVRELWPPSSQ